MDFPARSVVKNVPANAGDVGLIPGLGRFPEEGNGNLLQYSCMENFMEKGGWRATVHGVKESDMTKRLTHTHHGTSLVVQWLRHHTSAGDSG